MKRWMRRARAALVMGLLWAVAWAPIGVLIGFAIDPGGTMDEPWPLVGAYPGFIGGVLFSIVLAVAARRRRLEELSLGRVALRGGLAGAAVGALPFLLGDVADHMTAARLGAIVIGSIGAAAAASAALSLAVARRGARDEGLPRGVDAPALESGGIPPARERQDVRTSSGIRTD